MGIQVHLNVLLDKRKLIGLRDMHGLDKWTLPPYRLWARTKVSGQHESLDHPPQIPLFVGAVKTPTKREDNLTEALTSAATAVVG